MHAPQTIATPEGRFTAEVAGRSGAPLVLMLHGFPQTRHTWRHQVPALARAGYRVIAPDQRGYSPGVRPPSADLAAYRIDRLVADVVDLADAAGFGEPARWHLVGHDWGGQVAWVVAARHPDRIASLTVLSRPHPTAFLRAIGENADGQQERSRHHRAFHDPATATRLLEDGARRLRQALADQRVPEAAIAEYLSVLGDHAALESALSWYRAAGTLGMPELGPVAVPTLYLWGDADATVGRSAAAATAGFVTGPFRMEVLPGVGHFITDEIPDVVTTLLLDHLGSGAAGGTRLSTPTPHRP
jgi:pimeloyl-ACP methyl ester carboxylesterase